jgi:hypothetical protein
MIESPPILYVVDLRPLCCDEPDGLGRAQYHYFLSYQKAIDFFNWLSSCLPGYFMRLYDASTQTTLASYSRRPW